MDRNRHHPLFVQGWLINIVVGVPRLRLVFCARLWRGRKLGGGGGGWFPLITVVKKEPPSPPPPPPPPPLKARVRPFVVRAYWSSPPDARSHPDQNVEICSSSYRSTPVVVFVLWPIYSEDDMFQRHSNCPTFFCSRVIPYSST